MLMVTSRYIRSVVAGTLALILTACNLIGSGSKPNEATVIGKPLYEQYCTSCHGFDGEGQPDWKVLGLGGV